MQEHVYRTYKSMLFGLAYRMLGSAADAEDIVHDVFAQYLQTDKRDIANERAYLTKMTANRCINVLNSARHKREQYIGTWLPEPMPDEGWQDEASAQTERKEMIGYAYLVMLQRMTPLERAVYVLREALRFEYREIAEILERTELSCRKTYSRARKAVGLDAGGDGTGLSKEYAKPDRVRLQYQFVEVFLRAADSGDFQPLVTYLKEEVTLVSDGGGKVRAAIKPILGLERVLAFLTGLSAKGRFEAGFRPIRMNGEPGLALVEARKCTMLISIEWEPDGSRIRHLYIIVNPDKLQRFNRGSLGTSL